ncbi:MAG TPA: SIR2 family protein [Bryobacteraceae bacterium]|nr:SIR2 family protein [Bryobacteraceae bacterium]
MLDPTLGLAVSLQQAKGVYALLLGSGISRSSGVPTGWEVVQDLIRRVARLHGEDPADPQDWFREKYGTEPDYSTLLAELAPSPAERTKLLQDYFEPNEKDREEGRKLPSAAHRSIAELVASGYIRVILTTNFDRLMERALAEVGIEPSVIGSTDAAKGAMPLVHARCTLIKVNGDYLDPRFKNTVDELNVYEPEMNQLLDRVFDDYGLIVCGWSSDWDTALRAAIERAPNRRFTTYWVTRGEVSERAAQLITLRSAIRLQVAGADEFFKELSDRTAALALLAETDPLSAKVAVARAKQYLPEPRHRIRLYDLVNGQTEHVVHRTALQYFPTGQSSITTDAFLDRLHRYDSELDILLQLVVALTFFGQPEQTQELLIRVFRRVTEESSGSGMTLWIEMQRYPAVRLFYAVGLAAIAANQYGIIGRIAHLTRRDRHTGEEYKAITRLQDHSAVARNVQPQAFGCKEHTPLSNHLFNTLRNVFRDYLSSETEYAEAFDWFEYLICLLSLDAKLSLAAAREMATSNSRDVFRFWVPVGRFGWNHSNVRQDTTKRDGQYPPKVKACFAAGIFGDFQTESQMEKYDAVKALVDLVTDVFRGEWHIFW